MQYIDQLQQTYSELFIYRDGVLYYRRNGRKDQIGYEVQRGKFVDICGVPVLKAEIVWQYHFGRLKRHECILFKDRNVNNIRIENLFISKMCNKEPGNDVVISTEIGRYPSGK